MYLKSGRWKLGLLIGGLMFLLMPLFYSNYLGKKLSALELKKIELFEKTLVEITNTSNLEDGEDVSYELEMLQSIINDLKLVVINRAQKIDLYNFSSPADTLSILSDLKKSGPPPLISEDYTIYYKYPFTLTLLSYFPLFQFILLLVYAAIGYAVFNASRKEEQNRIWVGMAKETAHQLGTPISGMVGWIEELKAEQINSEERKLIVKEMEQDIEKLRLVADRFSKIGSKPELEPRKLQDVLHSSMMYISARASKNIKFDLISEGNADLKSMINVNLFSWVIENVLRNALDAMGNEGKIIIQLSGDEKNNTISIIDSGKGIPASQWKTIFKPGFTTKKRGWGLGLSLSKRIIENYHNGKIGVTASEVMKGTTISIQLPSIS